MDVSWWFTDNYDACRHGQQACPPGGQPCCRFLVTFLERHDEENEDNHTYGSIVFRAVKVAHEEHPRVLASKHNRAFFRVVFLSNMSGGFTTKNEPEPPTGFTAVFMMIETIGLFQETLVNLAVGCLKRKDVLNGCKHSFVKFIKARISCSCLDKKYESLRSLPKS